MDGVGWRIKGRSVKKERGIGRKAVRLPHLDRLVYGALSLDLGDDEPKTRLE